jgi:hypothetical protein
MTDEELIEELSEMGRHSCRAHLPMGERLRQASDRIEALTAALIKIREHNNTYGGSSYVLRIIEEALEKKP